MKIRRDDKAEVTVLRMEGKIMGGPDAEAFQKTVKELVAEGKRKIVLDLSKVSWVNSTGLGILISGHTTMQNNGGTMKLVGVNKRIDQIFMVTKLHTIFQTFEDEAEALESF
jgi:anti-sigma B factor antagonist